MNLSCLQTLDPDYVNLPLSSYPLTQAYIYTIDPLHEPSCLQTLTQTYVSLSVFKPPDPGLYMFRPIDPPT